MEKSVFSIIIPLAIFSLAIVMIGPVNVQATPAVTPVVCPAGYTCTPIAPQPVNCPAGYICTPTNPVTPVPSPVPIPPKSPINSCYSFYRNMGLDYGSYVSPITSTGADVVALQTMLIAKGFDIPGISSGRTSKGQFNEETRQAVMKYQTANGIPNTGFVGPLTRAKLNASCGNTSVTTNSATALKFVVTSPSNGETLQVNQPYQIVWTDSSSDNMGDSYSLVYSYTNSSGVYSKEEIASNLTVTSLQEIGSRCTGGYACRYTWTPKNTGTNASVRIDAYHVNRTKGAGYSGVFSIINNTAQPCVSPNMWNGSACVPPVTPPNISGYQKLPTDYNISGTASLASADEDKAFKWGAGQQIHGPDWKWLISITNSGSSTKTIKRMIVVHNTLGEGWATDASANNPVGKSLYTLATTQTTSCGTSCEPYTSYTDNIAISVLANSTKSFFAFGYPASQRFSGGYILIEFTDGTSATINIPTSSITPGNTSNTINNIIQSFITVLSPNGGETLKDGQTYQVRWNSRNVSSSSYVDIWLLDNPTRLGSAVLYRVPNTGSANWVVAPLSTLTDKDGRSISPSGRYVMFVNCSDNSCTVDDSDSSFTIAPSTNTQPSAVITSNGQTISLTPTISGTASGVSQIGVTLSNNGGKVYGSSLISVVNGNWSITVSPALVAGQYTIYVYDANNNKLTSGYLNIAVIDPKPPTTSSSSATVSAYLFDASSDKASTNFGPGLGIQNAWQNKNANDWHWRVIVTADANAKKNISSITINHNSLGEGWSTSDSRYYPLVVLKNGVQINTAYGNMVDISSAGTNTFDLYGQTETTAFSGGTITVKFGDGTSVSSSIPASSIKQAPVTNQTGAIWDAIREYYRNGGR